MAGATSRNKGAAFERQIAREITTFVGLECRRNLAQYQAKVEGGDLAGDAVRGYAIELKRAKSARLAQWRRQCLAQAEMSRTTPVLVYRLDRGSIVVNRWSGQAWYEQAWLDFLIELREHNSIG